MTSLLRRNRPTTAPRSTRLATAINSAGGDCSSTRSPRQGRRLLSLAVLTLLVAGPAAAQQPPQPYQPYRPPVPGHPPAARGWGGQPTVPPRGTTGAPQGYRPVGQPAGVQPPGSRPAPGSTGRVLYFQKPADALAPAGETAPDSSVAVAPVPSQTVVAVAAPRPDVPPVAQPAGVPSAIPQLIQPAPTPVVLQPGIRSDKQPLGKIREVDPNIIRLPGRDRITMMLDDAALERDIMNYVARETQGKFDKNSRFPPDQRLVPPGTMYQAKTSQYAPRKAVYEAGFVAHRRLHFEEKNSERYGWDLGIIQPFVSAMYFYKDVLLWPNSLASGAEIGFWDTSAGKCLPGSPVPYYLYPPGLTITGMIAEAGVIVPAAYAISPISGAAPFIAAP